MRQEVKIHYNIPNGWIREELGNLAGKITKGATPTTYGYEFQRSGINFIKIQNVFAGTIDLASITDFISEEAHQNQKKSILNVDDVLFSIAGTIGETSIIKPQHLPANTNQAFAIISGFSELLLPKYLEFQLRSFVSQKTKEKARGGAMNNVSLDDLKHLELLLPPLPEQHRIVAKIEELFSELDKGVESLKTAQAQLKVYRQALLKHAFEGKLTEAWRAGNQDKLETADALLKRIQQERAARYQQQLADWQANGGSLVQRAGKPKAPKSLPPLTKEELAELPELPDGWAWTRLGNTNVEVSDGPFGSNLKSSDYVDSGVRVVRLENIGALKFIEEKESYVTEEKYELLKRHTVTSGDIVFSSFIIENVRVALVPPSITKAINKADCFCVRCHGETLSNVFVVLYLSTRYVYKQLESLIHGVGRPRINTTQLKDVIIPVCSVEEQRVILAEIEARLSEVDQLELTLTTSLQQSEALRQSILKRAFSGQLVPQEPHDEPASELLARIQAERAKSSSPKSKGKKA